MLKKATNFNHFSRFTYFCRLPLKEVAAEKLEKLKDKKKDYLENFLKKIGGITTFNSYKIITTKNKNSR